MNTEIKIKIVMKKENTFIFIIECFVGDGGFISVESTSFYKSDKEAERDARESLSEFSTDIKVKGIIDFNYH